VTNIYYKNGSFEFHLSNVPMKFFFCKKSIFQDVSQIIMHFLLFFFLNKSRKNCATYYPHMGDCWHFRDSKFILHFFFSVKTIIVTKCCFLNFFLYHYREKLEEMELIKKIIALFFYNFLKNKSCPSVQ